MSDFVLLGGKWNTGGLSYFSQVVPSYTQPLMRAVNGWNTSQNKLSVSLGSSLPFQLYVNNADFDATGWNALTDLRPNPQSSPYQNGFIYLNDYYMRSYSQNKKQAIVAHEFGHAFGLAHTLQANTLMYYRGSAVYYDQWDIMAPTPDEIAGINHLYP